MKREAMMCLSLATLGLGCHPNREVVRVQNVERAMAVWGKSNAEDSNRAQMCLEYSSPAERLDSHKASLDIPIAADRKIAASFESAQSLAQIYTVTEIMQFGHAALYRLCEAAANGQLTKDEYNQAFRDTLNKMHELLRLQLVSRFEQEHSEAERLSREITVRRAQLCEYYKDPHSAENGEAQTKLSSELKELESSYQLLPDGARTDFAPPALPPPADFEKHVKQRKIAEDLKQKEPSKDHSGSAACAELKKFPTTKVGSCEPFPNVAACQPPVSP